MVGCWKLEALKSGEYCIHTHSTTFFKMRIECVNIRSLAITDFFRQFIKQKKSFRTFRKRIFHRISFHVFHFFGNLWYPKGRAAKKLRRESTLVIQFTWHDWSYMYKMVRCPWEIKIEKNKIPRVFSTLFVSFHWEKNIYELVWNLRETPLFKVLRLD